MLKEKLNQRRINKMEQKIKFKDLSAWLKIAVVFVWILAGYFVLVFLVGIILGVADMVI
jgi:ABC-type Fe3+ transport system permease subunit